MNKKLVAIISVIIALALVAVILFLTLGKGEDKEPAPENNDTVTDSDDVKPVAPPDEYRPSGTPENEQTPVDTPDNPNTPDNPAEPETPDLPTPVVPDPDAPTGGDTPIEPTPAEPPVTDNPVAPTDPTLPEVPFEPTPAVPEVPAEPTTPHTHAWDSGYVTKAPTCLKDGELTYTCQCGETYTKTLERVADAHSFDSGKLDGVMMVYTCKNCGETKKESTCNHKWTDWWTVVEGSCVDGYKQRTCEICYLREKEVVPAVGHCVYEVTGEGETLRRYWCIGCYTEKVEEFPNGNPNYKPNSGYSTPSNLPKH